VFGTLHGLYKKYFLKWEGVLGKEECKEVENGLAQVLYKLK
jgi:hypothetical protein